MPKDDKKKGKKKTKKKGISTDKIWSAGWNIGKPVQQARRDIDLLFDPQLDELNRLRGQVQDDYGEYGTQVGNIYDALGRDIRFTGQGIDTDFGQLNQQFQSGVSDIMGQLPQVSTAPDQAAFNQMLGSQALAGQNELQSAYQRMQDWNRRTATQGDIEGSVMQRNISGDLQDALEQIQQERADLLERRPDMFKQRLDELRQLAFERMMGMKEYRLRAAAVAAQTKGDKGMQKFLQELVGGTKSGKWKPGGGGKGGGGGGGGGGGAGGQGGPGYNQQAAQKAFAQLIGGDKLYRQLNPKKQTALKSYIGDKGQKIQNQLSGVMPGVNLDVSNQQLLKLLKKYARSQYREPDWRTGDDPR